MIELALASGACPARPMTYALPRAMRYPNATLDVPLDGCNLSVVASRGDVSDVLDFLARSTMRCGRPLVLANFDEVSTARCLGLYIFVPMGGGILIGRVEPCILRDGAPLILVAADRTRAFVMDGQGKLLERKVPSPARATEGIARGWAELIRRMNASVTPDGTFRHASYEAHLSPLVAAAAFA